MKKKTILKNFFIMFTLSMCFLLITLTILQNEYIDRPKTTLNKRSIWAKMPVEHIIPPPLKLGEELQVE